MSEWQPIETAPLNEDILLWQPSWENHGVTLRDAGMMVGSLERFDVQDRQFLVRPSMVGGYDMECEVTHPTHWLPLPPPPAGERK